jgi:hypothetical protein
MDVSAPVPSPVDARAMIGGGGGEREARLQVWIEVFRSHVAGVNARVDLQHRNANVALVLLSAFAGYLATAWSAHNLHALLVSPGVLVVPAAAILAQIFVWRHLDHDANIIDMAEYNDQVVRGALAELSGEDPGILSFEAWLNAARRRRPRLVTPLILLGNEHIAILGFGMAYVSAGWAIRVGVRGVAGDGSAYFTGFLCVASASAAMSLLMSMGMAWRYAKLGRRDREPEAGRSTRWDRQ